jgi:ABC-type polysaccharide/polyol phosphate transport system ATPase subunit
MKTVIEVQNLAKAYQLGEFSTGTLSRDIERWWYKIRGKEDPFLKIGEINDRTQKSDTNVVWSLTNINFEVNEGDALGIIGRNGAGKSTLLKILSQVTSPTSGRINIKGRIASLLEVGTGFHPELTGRENIFLNGAILGMTKWEISKKFDEIVDFSGVEKYIDTPVKRYSSGMYVRLAFAVAAHLESEILVVDEVLAVGDAEFQRKCLGKMNDVTKSQGRTVLFVSHNLSAIKELCNKALLLNQGQVEMIANSGDVIRKYLSSPIKVDLDSLLKDYKSRRGGGEVRFTKFIINNNAPMVEPSEKISINFKIKIFDYVESVFFYLGIFDPINGYYITDIKYIELCKGGLIINSEHEFNIEIEENVFRTGLFPLYAWIGKDINKTDYPFDILDKVFFINIDSEKKMNELGYESGNPSGFFNINYKLNKIL